MQRIAMKINNCTKVNIMKQKVNFRFKEASRLNIRLSHIYELLMRTLIRVMELQ